MNILYTSLLSIVTAIAISLFFEATPLNGIILYYLILISFNVINIIILLEKK